MSGKIALGNLREPSPFLKHVIALEPRMGIIEGRRFSYNKEDREGVTICDVIQRLQIVYSRQTDCGGCLAVALLALDGEPVAGNHALSKEASWPTLPVSI